MHADMYAVLFVHGAQRLLHLIFIFLLFCEKNILAQNKTMCILEQKRRKNKIYFETKISKN